MSENEMRSELGKLRAQAHQTNSERFELEALRHRAIALEKENAQLKAQLRAIHEGITNQAADGAARAAEGA